MPDREHAVSLDVLRRSAQTRVEQTSLRQAAREIGISHPALRDFLNGTAPRGTTAAKLHAWYEPDANELIRLHHEIETLKAQLARFERMKGIAGGDEAADACGPSDVLLRTAVRTAVHSSSQRIVAEQIGVSHRGLAKFLDGSTPRENTRRKLREWYVREASARSGADETTVRAAIDVLLGGLPEEQKSRAAARLIEVVRQAFSEAKMEPPDWIDRTGA